MHLHDLDDQIKELLYKRLVYFSENDCADYSSQIENIFNVIEGTCSDIKNHRKKADSNLVESILSSFSDEEKSNFSGKVACQGVNGSFSSRAAALLYPNAKLVFFKTFEDVFHAVESGDVTYGVIPVENSTAGSVAESYDLILKYRYFISAGVNLSITQNLLGVNGASIDTLKEVYSHPQAISQSEIFLNEHSLKAIPYANTAAAAKMIASKNDLTKGAIGSYSAAQLYGLEVIAGQIQSITSNTTRFVSISKEMKIFDKSDKLSIAFRLPHVTGSLYMLLGKFAMNGLNLTKIESRSSKNGNFEYLFFADLTGSVKDSQTIRLISELSEQLPDFAFLGNYNEICGE